MDESSSTSSSFITSSSTNEKRKKRSHDQVLEEDKTLNDEKTPSCKYGLKCYRKDVVHLAKYSHPEEGIYLSSKYLFFYPKKYS